MRHVTPFPGPRSVVILDNAVIHKQRRFVRSVSQAGGIVLYLPPYCWDLMPLDNGAYGQVKNYLKTNGKWLTETLGFSISDMLSAAFKALSLAAARKCFHDCKYAFP